MPILKPYPHGTNQNQYVQELKSQRYLIGDPLQEEVDLENQWGIDIIYRLRNMTPPRFEKSAELLLLATVYEGTRYKEAASIYAKFQVRINPQVHGRKDPKKDSFKRTYTAGHQKNSDLLVHGNPETPRTSLTDRAEEIMEMLEFGSAKAYTDKQNPYKVLSLTISLRDPKTLGDTGTSEVFVIKSKPEGPLTDFRRTRELSPIIELAE